MAHFPTGVRYRAAILFSKKSEKWIFWLNYGFFVKTHRHKPPLKFNFLQERLYHDSLCTLGRPRMISLDFKEGACVTNYVAGLISGILYFCRHLQSQCR